MWDHRHGAVIDWKEGEAGERQELQVSAMLRLERDESSAILTSGIDLQTPFEHWQKSFAKIRFGIVCTGMEPLEFFTGRKVSQRSGS